jgi:hypothetical protein
VRIWVGFMWLSGGSFQVLNRGSGLNQPEAYRVHQEISVLVGRQDEDLGWIHVAQWWELSGSAERL